MENDLLSLQNYLIGKNCGDIAFYDISKEQQDCKYVVVVTMPTSLENKDFALSVMNDLGVDRFPEGYNRGEWIIFDFDDMVLHSFVPASREKYSLDKLWQNKKMKLPKQSND